MEGQRQDQPAEIRVTQAKFWPCALLDSQYELTQNQLGHGTYGSVYKARNLTDDKFYALKKMQNFQDKNQMGFPITTFRQIKLLQGLNHQNILNIKQVVYEKGRNHKPPVIYLCLDLMDCDLLELISSPFYKMTPYKIQQFLKQILTGLEYLHTLNISHRDIKPSNILLNDLGNIKIADFGLAKKLKKVSTTKVVTLWYRAPELLLGLKKYTAKVDIWSVGCLAAQLILKKPLFQEQTNESQIIKKIYELTGTPDFCGWEQQLLQQAKNYSEMKPNFTGESTIMYYLKQRAGQFQNEYELLNLIEKMLRLNHHSRFSASECLAHDFFKIQHPYEAILPSEYFQQKKHQHDSSQQPKKKVKM